MNDSILLSIKKILGIASDYDVFNPDLIMCINTVLAIVCQLGIGPRTGFTISGDTETWSDLLSDESRLEITKTYVAQRVRLIFDPPTGGLLDAINNTVSELEWRLMVAQDNIEWGI